MIGPPPGQPSTGSTVAQRLDQLGLTLPAVTSPVGAYVPAMRTGTQVWTSGQLPFVDGRLSLTGAVGGESWRSGALTIMDWGTVSADEARQAARIAALNAVAAVADLLAAESGDAPVAALDRVVRVVKVTGFVASAPSFTGQPGVLDGASALLHQIFGPAGVHVRSAVGVAALPLGAPVEIELVVEALGQ